VSCIDIGNTRWIRGEQGYILPNIMRSMGQ